MPGVGYTLAFMSTKAIAGTRGPAVRYDCYVEADAAGRPGVEVSSRVEAFYGDSIRSLIGEGLEALGATNLAVRVEDSGALPFTMMARLETAVRRLRGEGAPQWLPPRISAAAPTGERHRLRRSLLFVPGNTPRFFHNAGLHQPDAVILDLEDSVAAAEKDAARVLVRNALRAVSFCGAETMVRINPLPLGIEDVKMLVPHAPQALVLPKIQGPEEVRAVDALCREMGGRIWLVPMIESARAAARALEIAEATPSVAGLAIGLEDYTRDIGAEKTAHGEEIAWVLGQVVNAARAAGVQPLGPVYTDLEDLEGLRAHARRARTMGFEGVLAIHPLHVRGIHEGFTPQAAEVERARRIVEAFRDAEARGLAAVAVDGEMIDPPVVARAERVLRRAVPR